MESQVSDILISDFMKYFKGNEEKYGVHEYDTSEKIVEGTKLKGKWSGWAKDSYKNFIKPTKNTYREHLEGTKAMGLCPIDSDNKVRFAVLDYDPYVKKEDKLFDIRIRAMVKHVYASNFPLLCFRSKSGGLHMYMFFKEPIKAKHAIAILRRFIPLLNLPQKTEIFPKQERLVGEESGNWINLPYFNHAKPKAYLFGDEQEQKTLGEATRIIYSKLQTEESVADFFSGLPYADAPPCLQALALSGGADTGMRNIYMFNFATYLKNKLGNTDDEFLEKLVQANESMDEPLPTKEILAMRGSHKGTNYTYKCKEEPLCSHCDKKECALREFGIGNGLVANVDYGTLTQYNAEDSAYYEWEVNGVTLKFSDEGDLMKQDSFLKQCVRKLHFLPPKMKNDSWFKILNEALEEDNLKLENIDEGDDISNPALLTVYLKEFLCKRQQAETKAQLMIGRVYYHKEHKVYYFRKEALINYLFEVKKFTAMGRAEITMKLKNLAKGHKEIVKTIQVADNPLRTTRVIGIPKEFIRTEDLFTLQDSKVEVDFKKYNEKPF